MLARLRARLFKGERRTAIVLSAVAGLMSKSVNFVMLFAVVPLTLPHLGAERFGVLMTVLGYGALFSFVDLGIGSALIRETARSNVEDEPEKMRDLLGSGLVLLVLIGLLFSGVLLVTARLLPVDLLFRWLPPVHAAETRQALTVFALIFGVALPLQGLQKIYHGFQRAYLTHAASAILSLLALAALYFYPRDTLTMPVIVAWVYGLPALAPLLVLPSFLSRRLSGYRPSWSGGLECTRLLLRSGGLYLLLQVGYVLGWSIDGSLTSGMLGASSAGVLAVVQRLFQLVTVPLGLLNAPLWPAYSDAVARGDKAFLRKMLKRSMLFTMTLAGLAALVILVFKEQIISVWFGKQLTIPVGLLVLAAVMAVLEATGTAFAMYLNGLHILKPQLFVAGSFILICLPIKYLLIDAYALEGLVASTIFCYLVCVVLPYATIFRRQIFSPLSQTKLYE